jgi:hypothetical protein
MHGVLEARPWKSSCCFVLWFACVPQSVKSGKGMVVATDGMGGHRTGFIYILDWRVMLVWPRRGGRGLPFVLSSIFGAFAPNNNKPGTTVQGGKKNSRRRRGRPNIITSAAAAVREGEPHI